MRRQTAVMALVAILALAAHSAPCPHFDKRQLDMLGELVDNSVSEVALANDTQSLPAADEAANAAEVQTPDTVNNLAGNSITQIDDSTNSSLTNIEYPDDTQMTGNTGTAVSGNNNDIMPIINAPVTVIITSADNDHHSHPAGGRVAGSTPQPPPLSQQLPMWQQQQQTWAVPGGQPALQQVAPPYPGQVGVDPFGDRIQQLIAYALAVSQGHIRGIAS
ncbi:hypothetical protein IWW39_002932 [Coemansia spiralis]|uniref:Uncharacterized protein n=1 Tax=Coemansia spiralis TaxID=417178 RepID=A0A9W8GJK3_9FUNG|nr:hypothetical protein IWW39_002932 [Coemansia spiralis]